MNKETFLGFDLRLQGSDYVSLDWSADRRSIFLLNERVAWPLSVDTNVWPSLFGLADMWHGIKAPPPSAQPEDYWGETADLWRSYDAMTKRGGHFQPWYEKAVPIAIFLSYRDAISTLTSAVDVLAEEDESISPPDGMTLAGYDIADNFMLSGLLNCGYDPGEKEALSARFGSGLNGYGLFTDLGAAVEFKRDCDQRVEGHSPFYVYSIYWLEPEHRRLDP